MPRYMNAFLFTKDTRLQRARPRGLVRRLAGSVWFFSKRNLSWMGSRVYSRKQDAHSLPYIWMAHRVPLRRHLNRDEERWTENKIHNLSLAIKAFDGVVISPDTFVSFWRCIGIPSRYKGYKQGLFLSQGELRSGTGGGLCQLSNFLFWMMLHTPLTITERWRHSYDVFPDRSRTQPFGSGATCFFPSLDLEAKNATQITFQIRLWLTEHELVGEIRADRPKVEEYSVIEKDHCIESIPSIGYVRSNSLWRLVSKTGVSMSEELICRNTAKMMYAPILNPPSL